MRKLLLSLAVLAMSAGGLVLASGPAAACIPCPGAGSSTVRCCSPIIIDVDGSGFHLTSAAHGVPFDFFGDGRTIQMAWIAPGSTNAFLVLPRDGQVTNGKELFGNITPQPRSADPNGFLALASLNALTGGRDRSVIDSRDPLYYKLRLWQFSNRDGKVVAGKLSTLPQLGIKAIYLNYSTTTTTDRYGNQFRYQARIVSTNPHAGKYAYDVFFSAAGAPAAQPGSGLGARLPAGLALIAVGLLLAIQPARRRRARLTSVPAGDVQPAASTRHPDLTSKS
jgi:hypothetical protein